MSKHTLVATVEEGPATLNRVLSLFRQRSFAIDSLSIGRTNEPGIMPVVTFSPDGKWVIYQCVVGRTIDLHAVPTEGGDPRVVVASDAEDYHPSVSSSGRWVYYLPDHKNIYRVPGPVQNWRSAAPEKITDFSLTPISFIENPQLSRDGKHLAYSRGRITSDVWLLTLGTNQLAPAPLAP